MIKRYGLCLVFKEALACCAIFVFIFGGFSCGKQGSEFRPKIVTNSEPIITSVTISPKNPNIKSNLDVLVQSRDPDGDSVTYYYQWMKNEEEISGEKNNNLRSGNIRKGDLIQVKVIPSDGKVDGKPFLSDPVNILNTSPMIQELWIEPKMAYENDTLRAHVKGFDADEDSVRYSYQWEKNGVAIDEERIEVLEQGRFNKGDTIAVIVRPDDRESQGSSQRSKPIIILNSPPIIVSSPPTSVEGNNYMYQVKAYDPDNDPLSFAIKSVPKGMEIDQKTGLIRWTVQWKNRGTHSIEIEVSDKEGATSSQRFDLNVEIR